MSALQASCPACGAPITFKVGSAIVVVCEYCHSVVARGDRQLEDLGKVAEVGETGSPLAVGLKGVYQGVPFELMGRAQLAHPAGGVWDEWYAAFADGRWGWLAEAQGKFYVTFERPLPEQALLPPFERLQLGQPVAALAGHAPLVVVEKNTARPVAAKGEIPYKLIPGREHRFADLSGPQGEFATLDYGDDPVTLYVGREVPFAQLGIRGAPPAEREARRVGALQLSCPQCAGPLELRAPDKTERVACPNCGALLDAAAGKLKYLKSLQPGKVKPIIPIGATGNFGGVAYTVIGFMQRSVTFEGVKYYWEEYLLYEPAAGFRWLVRSDDNWNFVETLPPGVVLDNRLTAHFNGDDFKLYQNALARVEYVIGEFYWKVTTGEKVNTADYIHPPYMLSKEVTVADKRQAAGEINWSLGTYLRHAEVERAFNLTGLPRTSKVAPNQPFLYKNIYRYWGLLMLAALLLGLIFLMTGPRRQVFDQTFTLQPVASQEATQVIFTDPFELQGNQNLRITATSPVQNSWLYFEGDLINEATGLVQAFSMPIEYYSGVEGGESWSEGSPHNTMRLSALPAGTYTLRLEAQWERHQSPAILRLEITQGVPRLLYIVLVLIVLSILPVIIALYHLSFEKLRWADSDYSPYDSGGSEDEGGGDTDDDPNEIIRLDLDDSRRRE